MTRFELLNEMRLNVPVDDSIGRQLIDCHLLAVEGNVSDASATLKSIIGFSDDMWPDGRLALLLGALLIIGEYSAFADIVSKKFGSDFHLEISVSADIDQYYVLLLRKIQHNHIQITFSKRLTLYLSLENQMLWFIWIIPLLRRVAVSRKVSPGAAFFNQWDAGMVPGLSFCASQGDFFLLPDNVYIPSEGYKRLKQRLLNNLTPWHERKKIAFWRGATTGQIFGSSRKKVGAGQGNKSK